MKSKRPKKFEPGVLVHKHKHDTDYYDASTPEAMTKGLKAIFKANDSMEYYYDLKDSQEHIDYCEKEMAKKTDLIEVYKKHGDEYTAKRLEESMEEQKRHLKEHKIQADLYSKAKKGSEEAILDLLEMRDGYEYEGFDFKHTIK